MAASATPRDVKSLLECSICLHRFNDPRMLPCLHSYCFECLTAHVASNKETESTFSCPDCRDKCVIPEGGVDSIPKNFFVNAMKDAIPPAFLREHDQEIHHQSPPVMCQQYDRGKAIKHGNAIIFCAQCDAHFCHVCSDCHELSDDTKDHTVTSLGETNPDVQKNKIPSCELHRNQAVNWYCKTCSLPACPECIIEKHNGHANEKLSVLEAACKLDMLDVSKLASKRIEVLQKISADLNANAFKMEEELDQASRDISESANNMCRLIRLRETTLQDKVEEAREADREHFMTAKEGLGTVKDNVTSLKLRAEALYEDSPEQALSTVQHAPIHKQEFLRQQDESAASVQWHLARSVDEPGQLSKTDILGSFDVKTSIESEMCEAENVTVGAPFKTIKLEYTGNQAVLGIAPIYGNLICVAHFDDQYIWVYTNEGKLKQKIQFPGINRLSGMQTCCAQIRTYLLYV